MRRLACTTLLAALLPSSGAIALAAAPSIKTIIETQGRFVFTDGSSVFRLEKGGGFSLDPVGISGRTIRGVWRTGDFRTFTIIGKWSWVNGLSRNDDYRRMKLQVSYHRGLPKPPRLARHKLQLQPVYFTVEELVAVSKATYDKRSRSK